MVISKDCATQLHFFKDNLSTQLVFYITDFNQQLFFAKHAQITQIIP